MIHTTGIYILSLVHVTLTLIPGDRDAWKMKLPDQLSHKVLHESGWNLLAVETCWCVEPHAHNLLSCPIIMQGTQHYSCDLLKLMINIFVGFLELTLTIFCIIKTLLLWFCTAYFYHWLACRHLWINIFQTWYDDRHNQSLHFDTSLNDLDLHWRSQFYRIKILSLCNYSIVKCPDVARTLGMVDKAREMTAHKSLSMELVIAV